MVDRCCSVPTEFGVLAPTAAPKSTRERPLAYEPVHTSRRQGWGWCRGLHRGASCPWSKAVEEPRHRLADRAVQCGGNRRVRWTGARGPLARIAVFGTFRQLRSCGTRRPPPMSVLCLCGVGPTAAPHRTFADPAPPCLPTVPLLPLRILSSQMPLTATLSPGIHLRRYHGESLSKKGAYLMESDKRWKCLSKKTKRTIIEHICKFYICLTFTIACNHFSH